MGESSREGGRACWGRGGRVGKGGRGRLAEKRESENEGGEEHCRQKEFKMKRPWGAPMTGTVGGHGSSRGGQREMARRAGHFKDFCLIL